MTSIVAFGRTARTALATTSSARETGEVLVDGTVVAQLTETESETFNVLIRVYPLPVPRRRLVEEMRRFGCYWHIDTAKVVIARIRTKLGPGIIESHSRGYLFSPRFWVEHQSAY